MGKLSLKTFERRIRVRPLRIEDFDAIVAMQERCFPGMAPWKRDQIESQLRRFPEGQIGVEYAGRLVASSSSLIVDSADYSEWHNWRELADGGYITNHDPEGDTLYGIEVMVDPEFRGHKLSRRIYGARKELARERNLMRIMIGGRIPGYGEHAERMSAREYVERVMSKSLFDPVLTAQLANGFVLKGLIPNYFPSDTASRGYATYLEWTNLDYVADRSKRWRRIAPVRVCAVQYEMRAIGGFEEFARQCEYFIDVASDYKADFVVFPELLTTQLLSCIPSQRPGLAARQLSEFTPAYLELFTRLAIKYNVNVLGGTHFTVEHESLHNVAYLFRRDGTIGKQYKIHVTPNERRWWGVSGGDRVEVFDTDRGRVAILICYDIQFPELARIAVEKGAEILFVPLNTDERAGYQRVRYCAQARAIENHVYVVLAGATGNLPFVDNADVHYAQSGIYTPCDFSFSRDGIGAECEPNIETLVVHDVDLELSRRHRVRGTVQNLSDRRRDLYRVRWKEDDEDREM